MGNRSRKASLERARAAKRQRKQAKRFGKKSSIKEEVLMIKTIPAPVTPGQVTLV
jgi:hypothetical protein